MMTSLWKFTSEIWGGGFGLMTNDDERGEGGKKCRKFDDVICERPLMTWGFAHPEPFHMKHVIPIERGATSDR